MDVSKRYQEQTDGEYPDPAVSVNSGPPDYRYPGPPDSYPGPPVSGYPPPQGPGPVYSQPMSSSHVSHQAQTTVVIQQPTTIVQTPRGWTSGTCSCFDDMGICCCGLWLPCCLASSTAGEMDESVCLPCCVPGALTALRVKLRTQENITGTICDDCLMEHCCGPCAWCQLAREVKFVKATKIQQGTAMRMQ